MMSVQMAQTFSDHQANDSNSGAFWDLLIILAKQ